MQIVTTREFRANQKKYFDLAERETVIVSRKNARPIVISVADDEDFISKKNFSLSKDLMTLRTAGPTRCTRMKATEFLKRTETCMK